MKKLLLAGLVASSAFALYTTPAHAAEVGKEQTDVGIRFETDGPNKPGQGPFKDNLALVWTPSKFDFGKQKVADNIATYNNTVAGDQYLVVNDDRAGETTDGKQQYSGWKVTATLSDLVAKDATKLAAKLTFNLGDAQKYDIGAVDPDTNDYTPNPVEGHVSPLSTESGANIKVNKNVTLEAGKAGVEVLGKTKTDDAKGGFATKLADTKLVVTTSKGQAGKAFTGSVTWNLNNTYE